MLSLFSVKKMRRSLKKIVLCALAASVLAVLGIAFFVIHIIRTLPSPTLIENRHVAESTKIFDRTGKTLLYEIHGEEKRTIIPLADIPKSVAQATIAAEDENFYSHHAFDWKSILRAFLVNALHGRVVQGGSTITQQLAKKAFLSDERTFARKIREFILAIQLEKRYTKDQVLELYLNQVPYGSNAYGIEAASQEFFGKPAKELTVAESALLAALPRAPTYYSPWGSNQKVLLARRDYILEKMEKRGVISRAEKESAFKEKPSFARPSSGIRAPHFVIEVQNYLNAAYGEDFVKTHGLKVTTTLNWKIQEFAEGAVRKGAADNERLYHGTNAALVAEDPKTGQILALVGSRDYFDTAADGNFNVATQGLRQPGSALKPFVYVAAFQKGYTPDTIVFDVPTEFDTTGDPLKSYHPEDYDGSFRGPVTMRRALAQSLNVPSVQVLYLVGLNDALHALHDFGLSTLTESSRYGLSLILGGGEIKLIDLVGAYAALSQEGLRHDQSLVLKVETKDRVLEEFRDHSREVIDPQYVRLVNDILSDQEARAPIFGTTLTIPGFPEYQIAVKTGTSNDYRDAWAVGFTPSIVVGVWGGNNDNTPMTKTGGNLAAAPIWRRVMGEILKDYPPDTFTKPDEIVADKPMFRGEYVVNYRSGNQLYPQIHSILFYVDRDNPRGPEPTSPSHDPQFENWEQATIKWAETHLPNFAAMNQPLPPGSIASLTDSSASSLAPSLTIRLIKPENGSFAGSDVSIEALVNSDQPITKVTTNFNGHIIDSRAGNFGTEFRYITSVPYQSLELQNAIMVIVENQHGAQGNAEAIVFKQS